MMKHTLLAAGLICCLCTSAYAMDKSTYFTGDGDCTAAKVVYDYKPDSLFQVNAQMGFVSDVQLKARRKDHLYRGRRHETMAHRPVYCRQCRTYLYQAVSPRHPDQHDHQHRCS